MLSGEVRIGKLNLCVKAKVIARCRTVPCASFVRKLRESAQAFADHILANPIVTEYGFLAEYIFLAGGGGVGDIHCYILDTSGIVAFVVLLNSHHEPFSAADPQSIEDCTSVLIDVVWDVLTSD